MPHERLPDWFRQEPDRDPHDAWYHQAFWDLSTERQLGFSAGPIPISRILEYGQRACFEGDMLDVFVRIIRTMDGAYLSWVRKEQESARATARREDKK